MREAADILGVSKEAVRKRVIRGTLRSDTEEDGRRYVYLDAGGDESPTSAPDALISEMHSRIQFLEDELRRKDAILLNMTEAMKALNRPAQEAPPEARESPQTAEEAPDRAEPQPAMGGTQEGTEHPQQRGGWLAPVDKLPWWQYVLGLCLVFPATFLVGGTADQLYDMGYFPRFALAAALAGIWTVPGVIGFWVGIRQRILRLWSQIIPFGALIPIEVILAVYVYLKTWEDTSGLDLTDSASVTGLFGLPGWLLFVSGALIGNSWQRRRIGRISDTTPASPVSRTIQGAAQQTRKDLTPTQQAVLGWGGAIISALITLVGTIISVRSGP